MSEVAELSVEAFRRAVEFIEGLPDYPEYVPLMKFQDGQKWIYERGKWRSLGSYLIPTG